MRVRPETGDDAAAIEGVHLAAFPTCAEADLVRRLHEDFDSEISLVAEQGGAIVGHVMLSRMEVTGDGEPIRALGLGPVGVLPGHQGAGIGGALIESALAVARTLGEELVFVLGEPAYYERFGFTAATARPFASPYAGPYFLALALRPGAASPASGSASYAPAFSKLPEG
jgi:putative acetyltransferase